MSPIGHEARSVGFPLDPDLLFRRSPLAQAAAFQRSSSSPDGATAPSSRGLFNLFVVFDVMRAASYGMALLGSQAG
jgi:hypothetical protein